MKRVTGATDGAKSPAQPRDGADCAAKVGGGAEREEHHQDFGDFDGTSEILSSEILWAFSQNSGDLEGTAKVLFLEIWLAFSAGKWWVERLTGATDGAESPALPRDGADCGAKVGGGAEREEHHQNFGDFEGTVEILSSEILWSFSHNSGDFE